MIIWRGWGILALLFPIFWFIAVLIVAMSAGYQSSDPIQSAAEMYRMGAAGLALAAISLWPVVRRRDRTAPGVDHLAFVPMRYWQYVIVLGAVGLLVASFVPAALQAAAS